MVMDDNKKMVKHILVTTDFSKNSDFALLRALEIAEKFNARVTLLHVIQKNEIDNFLDNTLKKFLPKGLWLTTEEYKETLLQEKIQPLLKKQLRLSYYIIPKGKPAKKILQYAKKNKIDLLVTGAHGKYTIRDSFVGTTAEYIAKHTKCPVLVVKNPPKNTYQKIFIPVDFSNISKKALNYTLKLFHNTDVRLFHVGDYEYENVLKEKKQEIRKPKFTEIKKAIFAYLENKMKKFTKGYSKKLNKHPYKITLGYPGPTIINEVQKLKYDLVVMGTQGHGRIHYLFIGSVANWVLTEGSSDILLVPPK